MAKIAIFLTVLDGGGAERVMLNLARGFAESGHEVDLVLIQAEGPYLSQISPSVRLVNLDKKRLLLSIPALIHYMRRERPTALLAAMDTNVISVWARRLANIPTHIIVTVHNVLSEECRDAKQFKRRITPQLARWFYPWADTIVAVSQGVSDDLVQLGLSSDKVKVIYNPVLTPEFMQQAKQDVEHEWFASQEIPVILGVGRLTQQKDFLTLIRAFAKVRQQRLVRLILLGEGEERSNLENLISELEVDTDVALPGFVDNPYAFMYRASLLVMSSIWEGFGNVLVEAMAAGIPVVSTNCRSGPDEILANGKYGKLIPVGNIEMMASAIIEALDEPLEPEILRQRAGEFTLNKASKQYEDVFLF